MQKTIEELNQLLSHYQALEGYTLEATEKAIKDLEQEVKQTTNPELRNILKTRLVELSNHRDVIKGNINNHLQKNKTK